MDKLNLVQFETTAACPARCLMCPHKEMKRPIGLMDMNLVKKIVDESLDLGVSEIMPFLHGEPFADPRIMEILVYMKDGIKKRNLSTKIGIYTNLELITYKQIVEIYQNFSDVLSYFEISFNGMTEESYYKIMGLKHFYQNLEKAKVIIDFGEKLGRPFPIKVGMVDLPESKDQQELFKKVFNEYGQIYKCWNYAGYLFDFKRDVPCLRVLSHMTILWDGRVGLCCMDMEGKVILGDVSKQSIKEVWENNQEMRDKHRNLDFNMPLCDNCNME